MCQCGPHFISRVARYRSRAKSGVRLYLTHAHSCRLQADPYSACNTGESCATAGDTDLAIAHTNFALRGFCPQRRPRWVRNDATVGSFGRISICLYIY
ncbi:Uncharacterised protein [Mycobacteroides abscessus subsp. abscessus]|nr:Uncharacterised protein [Mycobacteroides abscessus subsp. abscessus]